MKISGNTKAAIGAWLADRIIEWYKAWKFRREKKKDAEGVGVAKEP